MHAQKYTSERLRVPPSADVLAVWGKGGSEVCSSTGTLASLDCELPSRCRAESYRSARPASNPGTAMSPRPVNVQQIVRAHPPGHQLEQKLSSCLQLVDAQPSLMQGTLLSQAMTARNTVLHSRCSPSSAKGKFFASPVPIGLGNKSRTGPVSTSDVATVSMTLSPMTLGEPNTQKTSYASNPISSTTAVRKLLRPMSCEEEHTRALKPAAGMSQSVTMSPSDNKQPAG